MASTNGHSQADTTADMDLSMISDLVPSSATLSAMSKGSSRSEEKLEAAGLSMVYKRHGRTDLVPMPSESPLDPLNWPA